jgi:hypothetical protein
VSAVALVALLGLPIPVSAHGTCSLTVDTFLGTDPSYVKGQVRISCTENHYTVCAQVGLQYRNYYTNFEWRNTFDSSGQYNCNDNHNVKTAQATSTHVCDVSDLSDDWRAYGFGVVFNSNGDQVHRNPSSGYKFDATPLDVNC